MHRSVVLYLVQGQLSLRGPESLTVDLGPLDTPKNEDFGSFCEKCGNNFSQPILWGWRHCILNGYLTPEPLIRTWDCRISLDSEWCEKFKNIYVDKTRYEKFRSTDENRPKGPARGRFPTVPATPLILGKDRACDIWLCPVFFYLNH